MFGAGFLLFAGATYRNLGVGCVGTLLACVFVPIPILLYYGERILVSAGAIPLNGRVIMFYRFDLRQNWTPRLADITSFQNHQHPISATVLYRYPFTYTYTTQPTTRRPR